MTPLSPSPKEIFDRLSAAAINIEEKGYESSYCISRMDTHDPDYMTCYLYYRINYNSDMQSVYVRVYFDNFEADLVAFEAQCLAIEDASEGRKTQAILKLARLTEDLKELEIDAELITPIFDKIKEMSGMLITHQPYAKEDD